VPEPGRRAQVTVTLTRPGHPPFVATLVGDARRATLGAVLRTAATRPLEPLTVMARIKWHGVRLWARRLPIQPRPIHYRQEAVQ